MSLATLSGQLKSMSGRSLTGYLAHWARQSDLELDSWVARTRLNWEIHQRLHSASSFLDGLAGPRHFHCDQEGEILLCYWVEAGLHHPIALLHPVLRDGNRLLRLEIEMRQETCHHGIAGLDPGFAESAATVDWAPAVLLRTVVAGVALEYAGQHVGLHLPKLPVLGSDTGFEVHQKVKETRYNSSRQVHWLLNLRFEKSVLNLYSRFPTGNLLNGSSW